jgi:hypothetical protein
MLLDNHMSCCSVECSSSAREYLCFETIVSVGKQTSSMSSVDETGAVARVVKL